MDVLDGVPRHVLGYAVKTRIQIILHYLIPACLELQAYIIQTVADTVVTIQHFRDHRPLYGWLTLVFLGLPAFVCFFSVMISSWQWPEAEKRCCCSLKNFQFCLQQLFNFFFFPMGSLYRFSHRIFWSMESLFHNKNKWERRYSVMKAAETSPFELYHFMQAYIQAAPQAILQLFILLRENIFRNYETTNVQVLSVIFSLINISVITMSFQRFESQKLVGRNYPWATIEQIQHHRRKFLRTQSYIDEVKKSQTQGMRSITNFPENDIILEKFQSKIMEPENFTSSLTSAANNTISEKIKNDKKNNIDDKSRETKIGHHFYHDNGKEVLAEHIEDDLVPLNVTDDEKLNSCQEQQQHQQQRVKSVPDELDTGRMLRIKDKRYEEPDNLDEIEIVEEISLDSTPLREKKRIENMNFDSVPVIPAPPPPHSMSHSIKLIFDVSNSDDIKQKDISNSDAIDKKQRHSLNAFNRLSTLKDMLVLNTEFTIRKHIPRPPHILVKHAKNAEEWQSDWKMKINHNQSKDENIFHMDMPILRDCENSNIYVNRQEILSSDNTARAEQHIPLPPDKTDFLLPTKRKIHTGIEQDDFIAKSVSFFGWILFIFMRMISLSIFSAFYPWEFVYLVAAHYFLMLACLIYETKFQEKIQRTVFYLFLAYIYIFVILEFRIKFKHLRLWCIGYFTLVMVENFTSTLVWYFCAEYESWWFEYLFDAIIVSGVFNIGCMLVYYIILKPKDIILIET